MNEQEIRFADNSNKTTLIGVLLIVCAIAGYTFIIRPVSTNLDVVKADVSTKTTTLDGMKTQLETLNKAEQELQLTSEVQRQESIKAVPVGVNEDSVIKDIIQIAKQNNVALHSISFAKGAGAKDGIGSLRISSTFEGNYQDLTNFLMGLEQNGRIFRVDSVNVQVNKLEISDVERASFSLSIDTYFQQK
ncbi:MAG: type 4a pilus biogenesis protein PilO [Candidatus Peregrinibacteria bacterium]|nr:type 4a pilus biogenesis protein PilO [Candidatus Peregrinibacteria bacterium]